MATLFDRLNQELEAFGKRAQEVFDDGRVRLDLMRIRNQRDAAARELGYLVHRRERGHGEVEQGRIDAAMLKMDDLGKEVERLEKELIEEQAAQSAPVEVHHNAGDTEETVATPS
ncbi:MAG TPA: hypothetical protein VFS94_03055 [Gemmatimonadales bacterium]|nr:hypothetical protein [Gemmatimonadales bacterium]